MSFRSRLLLVGDSILCNYAFNDRQRTKSYFRVSEVEIFRVQSDAAYQVACEMIKDYDIAVVSTLMNQISTLENRWSTSYDEEKSKHVMDVIDNLASKINKAADDSPNTKIIVLPPTIRTEPKWLFDCFKLFTDAYLDLLSPRITKARSPPINDTDLRGDGVHLKDLPLQRFREYVLETVKPSSPSWDSETRNENS